PGIGAALLAGHGREARQHFGPGSLLEQRCLGVGRNVLGGLEYAEGAAAVGVRLALGNLLAVEMRHLLEEVDVMKHDRAVAAAAERMAVALGRRAGACRGTGGEYVLLVAHLASFLLAFMMLAPGRGREGDRGPVGKFRASLQIGCWRAGGIPTNFELF